MKKKHKKSVRETIKEAAIPLPSLYRRSDLTLIRLDESTTKRSTLGAGRSRSGESSISFKGRLEKQEDKIWLVFLVEFDISIAAGKRDQVRISAIYRVVYSMKGADGATDKDIEEFGKVFLLINTWPYWREFVQSSTVRMGLPPLTLPLFSPIDHNGWSDPE